MSGIKTGLRSCSPTMRITANAFKLLGKARYVGDLLFARYDNGREMASPAAMPSIDPLIVALS